MTEKQMLQDTITNMNLSEQIRFTRGRGAWHTWDADGKLPELMMCDGPHGLRKQKQDAPGQNNDSIPATCFPTESAIACSWDTEAVEKMAGAIAEEALAEDVAIILGCGVNIKRSPLCGRNFEYFSEDPYLAGTLAVAYINAMQALGVGTSLKHFAGNNQETHRQTANSQIDHRALREIYLSAFEMAVKQAAPRTVMASYNRLNGTYACESRELLTDILRTEWGYRGTVISDWGACVDSAACIQAGMDLEMPDSLGLHTRNIQEALKKGSLKKEELERAVQNVGKLLGQLPKKANDPQLLRKHHRLAVTLEKQSAVLLKNDSFFPVSGKGKIIIIGELAKNMRFQGGGSSHINAAYFIDTIEALQQHQCDVVYLQGYHSNSELPDEKLEQQVTKLLETPQGKEATVLFFGGLGEQYEGEGYDRKNLKLPQNQLKLLNTIMELHPRTGVVTFSGAPFEMPFAQKASAILQMYLGGQGVGEAAAALILGEDSPCGKLAESWPRCAEDVPCCENFGKDSDDVEYRESIYVGYRYYDAFKKQTLFPFGHGLTYTSFSYSDLTFRQSGLETREYAGGNLEVGCTVKNTGSCAAAEIVQIYVKNPECNYLRAEKELRGFQKINLEPGQEKEVIISLSERSFSIYADDKKSFLMPSGSYEILVAASSADVRLAKTISVKGVDYDRDDRESLPAYFDRKEGLHISSAQFEILYNDSLSQLDYRKKGEFDLHDSLSKLSKHSLLGKIFLMIAERIAYSMYPGKRHDDPEVMMTLQGIHEGCLDSIICQSGGIVPYKIAEAIVLSANGHFWSSIGKLLERKKHESI